MTEDYCEVEDKGTTGGCQSNCDQPGPKNKASTQSDRIIGYYEGWRYNSVCQGMVCEQAPLTLISAKNLRASMISQSTLSPICTSPSDT